MVAAQRGKARDNTCQLMPAPSTGPLPSTNLLPVRHPRLLRSSADRARNAKAAANIPMHKITNWYKPAPWYQLENQERSLEECSQLQSSSAAAKAAKELVFGDGEVAGPAAEAAAAELEAELAGGQQATTAACGSAVKRTRRR